MESWRTVWRKGFQRGATYRALNRLRLAILRDDPRLVQGSTTTPPPLMCVRDYPCEAADAVAWIGWQGGKNPACRTVGDVEEAWARACMECDRRLGDVGGCRWFLNWWDDTPRAEALGQLLGEVDRAIRHRVNLRSARRERSRREALPVAHVGTTDLF